FIEAYWMISKSRYLNKRDPVSRDPDTLDFWLNQLDERRFTQDFRVTSRAGGAEQQAVAWPDNQEREEISARIEEISGFRQYIGFVDGTLFPFAAKQELEGVDYYSRKCCYEMAALVTCKTEMFEGDQYLLADSGFAPDTNIVPVFKKPRKGQLTTPQGRYNKELSKIRV
ncbi:hypothetical protein L915_20971, partial [Phytophthora nicotianae]